RRHLPQTLARQPIGDRRAHDRAAALRLPNLPPATPLTVRLPGRRPHRHRPRRPRPVADLTVSAEGLNAYEKGPISRFFQWSREESYLRQTDSKSATTRWAEPWLRETRAQQLVRTGARAGTPEASTSDCSRNIPATSRWDSDGHSHLQMPQRLS